jgi:uncharacterized RDD family membrane protein YckC
VTGAIDVRYAGFWRRLAASLIDGFVLLPSIFLVAAVEGLSRPAAFLAALLGHAVYYAYILPLTLRHGGTLGKLALGVRVQPADGSSLTWRHVWRRSAVDMLAAGLFITGTFAGLSEIPFATYAAAGRIERAELITAAVPWMMWLNVAYMIWLASEFVVIMANHRRRALHDFIAGTVVVVTRPLTAVATDTIATQPAT